jgi:hypothetical protein
VHTSLDVVEEKLSFVGKTSGDVRELYIGLLYSTEEHKMYPLIKLFSDVINKDLIYLCQWMCNSPFQTVLLIFMLQPNHPNHSISIKPKICVLVSSKTMITYSIENISIKSLLGQSKPDLTFVLSDKIHTV